MFADTSSTHPENLFESIAEFFFECCTNKKHRNDIPQRWRRGKFCKMLNNHCAPFFAKVLPKYVNFPDLGYSKWRLSIFSYRASGWQSTLFFKNDQFSLTIWTRSKFVQYNEYSKWLILFVLLYILFSMRFTLLIEEMLEAKLAHIEIF